MKTTTPDNRWKPQEKANVSAPKGVAPAQEERRGAGLVRPSSLFYGQLTWVGGKLARGSSGGSPSGAVAPCGDIRLLPPWGSGGVTFGEGVHGEVPSESDRIADLAPSSAAVGEGGSAL